MNYQEKGSKTYLFSIVLVAVLGGLLFGYDTAVISGAEKGLQAFFLGAKDFVYTDVIHGITSSSALLGCILGSALSGFFATRFGRKKSLIIAGFFFFVSALGSYYPEFLFFEHGKPDFNLLIAFNIYRIIGGVGVGLASAICPMYIAEVAPSNIRVTLGCQLHDSWRAHKPHHREDCRKHLLRASHIRRMDHHDRMALHVR